ncbi:UbiD family decarboxylase [Paenibacillus allorhizosphaerae]|uniref:Phenolic acid decarboxylase n=1 Tax=Paenibacillus allorhizosphaerae TaxID=2849866 RepID=A0ABN7TQ83_9BACL|nr:UbiD family decarboxylase [Paenibacillus allorhizosphaerae]CAG7646165.1 Phenolic acid decarboxylase [Paenibacillus allorhizosphaerae]
MEQSLRAALEAYEKQGDLLRISKEVDWNFEAAAHLWKYKHGPTVIFDKVKGYDVPIIGNLLNERRKFGHAFGLEEKQIQPYILEAIENGIQPELVETGPVQEVVTTDVDLLRDLPIPIISEKDGGRYISAGVFIAKHPETGRRNVSICRIHVLEGNKVALHMAPTHLFSFYQRCKELGRDLEVAVLIGNHPAIMVASQMLVPNDEMEIAGGLFHEPVRMVRCKTIDLEVPAEGEIVLEGVIRHDERVMEGPFGEFPGTYSGSSMNPVLHIKAMTTRKNPLFQMIVGSNHPEHLWTGAIAREATLLRSVQAVIPTVQSVSMPEGGVCRFHAIISIKKRTEGEGKLAALAAITAQDLLKYIIVVDDDIDILNPTDVEWAMATRMRAHDDVQIIRDVKSNPIDPMAINRTVSKLIIDATLRMDEREGRYGTRAGVPEEIMKRVLGETE